MPGAPVEGGCCEKNVLLDMLARLARREPVKTIGRELGQQEDHQAAAGAQAGVLVDALMTVQEATALAHWVTLHDRWLTTIYITHGHADHWLGLSVLLARFPHARALPARERSDRCTQSAEHLGPRGDPRSDCRLLALAETV